MPALRLLAIAAPLLLAGTLPAAAAEQPATAQVAWGELVHGLKLHVHLDRDIYVRDRDLVNVTFTIMNTTAKDFPVTLGLTGEERTDLVVRDAAGRERTVPGRAVPRSATKVRRATIRPGRIARVNMVFDPAQLGAIDKRERFTLWGVFRCDGPDLAAWVEKPFRLESNEVAFEVEPDNDRKVPRGAFDGDAALSLECGTPAWKPGDPPLPFTVVMNRAADADGRSLLSIHGNTYYRLEVTGPDGREFTIEQPVALPAGESPHFRFADLPGGRRLGERLAWNPDGAAVERTRTLDEFHTASGPRALVTGRYRVRAVYEVDANAEAPFHYGIGARRIESNVVSVEIAR
jgi:hypothetical protein